MALHPPYLPDQRDNKYLCGNFFHCWITAISLLFCCSTPTAYMSMCFTDYQLVTVGTTHHVVASCVTQAPGKTNKPEPGSVGPKRTVVTISNRPRKHIDSQYTASLALPAGFPYPGAGLPCFPPFTGGKKRLLGRCVFDSTAGGAAKPLYI